MNKSILYVSLSLIILASCILPASDRKTYKSYWKETRLLDESLADTVTIVSGYVQDALTKEEIPLIEVIEENYRLSVRTDKKGYFTIQVPPGTIKLFVKGSVLGHDDFRSKKIKLKPKEKLSVTIGLGGWFIE